MVDVTEIVQEDLLCDPLLEDCSTDGFDPASTNSTEPMADDGMDEMPEE